MGIEKFFSAGRGILLAGSLVSMLSACESFREFPIKIAKEVAEMTYRIATLPTRPFQPFVSQAHAGQEETGPEINTCVNVFEKNGLNEEVLKERVCRLYLRNKIDANPDVFEEYFGVLIMENSGNVELTFGYYNGDMENMSGEKVLPVVRYNGDKGDDFAMPGYGKIDFNYKTFREFFEKPRESELDTKENPLKAALDKNILSAVKMKVFKKKLHDRIREGLKLADEQIPESNNEDKKCC